LKGLNRRYSRHRYSTPSTKIPLCMNPIASKMPSLNVPRVPSGIAGSTLIRDANALMIRMFSSSEISITLPQLGQTTLVVWSRPRNLIGLPQDRHANVFAFGVGGLTPSIELPQIGKMKIVKFHVLAEED